MATPHFIELTKVHITQVGVTETAKLIIGTRHISVVAAAQGDTGHITLVNAEKYNVRESYNEILRLLSP